HGDDDGDPVGGVDLLVDLTVGGGLVDHAGAVIGGDVVRDGDDPGVLRAPRRAVLGVHAPQRGVRDVLELGAGEDPRLGGGEDLLGALVAELLGVAAQQSGRHQVAALPRGG